MRQVNILGVHQTLADKLELNILELFMKLTKLLLSSSQLILIVALLGGGSVTAYASCPPPSISVTANPNVLWPPNHQYVEVDTTVFITDGGCSAVTITLLSVTSNEPDDGHGDGATTSDIVIVDNYTFELRAERGGSGNGRVYTITYEATDDSGNSTIGSAVVSVPLNQLF